MKTIGVFDSGVGGLSVANAIQKALPNAGVIFVNDRENIPYGNKTPGELLTLAEPILNLLSKKCDVIVVACNTVSTTLIEELRKHIHIPLIAMEPMVKPAAEMTKSKVIAVCATPTTLASKCYQGLKDTYAQGVKVIEPDCSDWTQMIETNQIDHSHIEKRIQRALDENADVIVLGCTHYHWIEDLINGIVRDKAQVLQPERAVIAQLKKVLRQLP
jgi:glutamate racemase